MTKTIEQLSRRREDIWNQIKEERLNFDESWRQKYKDHSCKSKVHAYNGEWFCEHLTKARNLNFKEEIKEDEDLLVKLANSL